MAYIKANERRDYVYYNVVESVWEDGVSRQNQLLYLGRLDNITPQERREFEVDLAEIDPSLLSDFYEYLVEHNYDFDADTDYQSQYPLEEIVPKKAVDYGPVAALHATAEKLGIDAVLQNQLQPKGGGPPLGKLLLVQIIAHCLEPRSIDATTDWYPLTALPGLLDLPDERLTTDTLYNSLDYIDEDGIERVHEELWTRVHELYDTPEDPVFYDLTSSYFEGTACPLSNYGYSSEHRPDKQQLVMGVAVNPDMVPFHHDIYTGNTNHSTTVDDAAERIDELGIGDSVLVMDKGCATKSKRERLRGEDPDADFPPIDWSCRKAV
ncbi:IS1634 family transposase [Halococcus thailandensis]